MVTCDKQPTRADLEKVAGGCEVDGAFVRPLAVAPVKEPGRRPGIRIVIAEGRNREVRCLVYLITLLGNGILRTWPQSPCMNENICWHVQVRTLVANAGLIVEALKRVRIGGYRLPRSLGIGQHVVLKPNEIRRVMDIGAQDNNEAINPFFAGYAL